MQVPTPVYYADRSQVSLVETYDATVSASTELTLNAATKSIEVAALTKAIFLKWGTSDASTTDWDAIIPADTVRAFAIPIDSSTKLPYTAVNFIEQSASAVLAVTEKAA